MCDEKGSAKINTNIVSIEYTILICIVLLLPATPLPIAIKNYFLIRPLLTKTENKHTIKKYTY